MIRTVAVLGLGLEMMLLAGCSGRIHRSNVLTAPISQSMEVTPRSKQAEVTTYPLSAPTVELEQVRPDLQQSLPQLRTPKPASPAILALMTQAEQSQSLNRLDTAAATLERALRIQPRSAELWSRLAQIRLQQKRLSLAENLARKSNTLATGLPAIMGRNWAMIAEVKQQHGDDVAALYADKKAAYYKKLAAS